jgi:hypothetical protein
MAIAATAPVLPNQKKNMVAKSPDSKTHPVDFHRHRLCDFYQVRNKLCHEYVNVFGYDWLINLDICRFDDGLHTEFDANVIGRLLLSNRAGSIAVLQTPCYCVVL